MEVKVISWENEEFFKYPVTVQEFYNKQSELPQGASVFAILFALAEDKVTK